jgi:hypothetical protein
MLEAAKQEWHCFRDDDPGRRFSNHHRRAHRSKSTAKAALRIGIGALLLAGGIVLLFIPGPGLLAILFGVALVAGESRRLASILDRGEIAARERWDRTSRPARIAVIASGALVAAAFAAWMAWRWVG